MGLCDTMIERNIIHNFAPWTTGTTQISLAIKPDPPDHIDGNAVQHSRSHFRHLYVPCRRCRVSQNLELRTSSSEVSGELNVEPPQAAHERMAVAFATSEPLLSRRLSLDGAAEPRK